MCLFFFFSSRRRHTRLQGDWSSDVCSSDLLSGQRGDRADRPPELSDKHRNPAADNRAASAETADRRRSEERRVGKECRARWAPEHEKLKRKTDTQNEETNTRDGSQWGPGQT